ncbi:MAG: UMP kinase [Acidimicrobiaceae bacterium]|nr:UMP kinase [Acidimicrobiaceae bacterium]MBO0747529.1 UMP kinase [Acidimicrobiaceae bacterium]
MSVSDPEGSGWGADHGLVSSQAGVSRRGPDSPWRRVVLKLSGEAFASEAADETIDGAVVDQVAAEIAAARRELELEIGVVVGGGNIWRGTTGTASGMDRANADYMGMLATVINAMALRDALERQEQPTRVLTAIGMSQIAEPYIRLRAIRHLEKGRVVIFAGGTGNPFFTTDTAGALRAVEIDADVLLKGTHGSSDGVYEADPAVDPTARRLDEVSYDRVIRDELRAMDLTAITLCKDNSLPIVYFSIMKPGNLRRALEGERIGTLIH